MKKLITTLIILAVAIALGLIAHTYPSYVLIQIGQWSIQTSLWFTLIALAILWLIIDFIATLIKGLNRSVSHIATWRQHHRRSAAQKALTQGILAYYTEEFDTVEPTLTNHTQASDQPFLHNWLAIQALIAQNQPIDHLLDSIEQSADKTQKHYINLLKAESCIINHYWQQAQQHLKQLPKKLAHTPRALKLKSQALAHENQWEDLWPILQTLANKLSHHLPQPYQNYQQQAFNHIVNNHTKRYSQLKQYWQQLSRDNQNNPECALAFLKRCQQLKPKTTADWTENWLENNYSPQVIEAYSQLDNITLKRQIDCLHQLLEQYNQPEIYYHLAYKYYQYKSPHQAVHYAQIAWKQGSTQALLIILLIHLQQQDSFTALQFLNQHFQHDTREHKSYGS